MNREIKVLSGTTLIDAVYLESNLAYCQGRLIVIQPTHADLLYDFISDVDILPMTERMVAGKRYIAEPYVEPETPGQMIVIPMIEYVYLCSLDPERDIEDWDDSATDYNEEDMDDGLGNTEPTNE